MPAHRFVGYLSGVDAQRTIRNLALVGFMGTGKSTIGRLVAAHLHFQFVDTDNLIEERTGKSIAAIFTEQGEAQFRELERQVVIELTSASRTVIATGGGLIINPANLECLKSHSLVVCLWASPEKIWERVRHQAHRPLLQNPNPLENIRRLLQDRESHYRQADILVNTEVRATREIAGQIAHHFRAARQESQ